MHFDNDPLSEVATTRFGMLTGGEQSSQQIISEDCVACSKRLLLYMIESYGDLKFFDHPP